MKIIHCADLHLDSKMETNLNKEQAAERKQELFATFLRMIDLAHEEGVGVIIIAGDLFDTADYEQKRIKNRVLETIESNGDIDFIYLRGNHDKSDFFGSLENKPDNLKLFDDDKWEAFRYGNVLITGMVFSPKNKGTNIYDKLVLKEEDINLVVLHGQESHYKAKNDGELIAIKDLQNKYIDYLALGHIHEYKCERLDNRGVYCYSGCLEGRGFDECGEKGCVLLDIGENGIESRFVPLSKRIFHEVSVDISECTSEKDIRDAIEAKIHDVVKPKDLLKIVLVGEIGEELNVDIAYQLQFIEDKYYFVKMYNHTKLKIDYMSYRNDISLKGEFIRYIEKLDISEEEKSKVILTGIRALAGREI
ncbi:MAG: metallophosphoesterase [Lachnospiraceae bacterium]|nr:metallophosphoesterase [Lachnospiraceae bacterium]